MVGTSRGSKIRNMERVTSELNNFQIEKKNVNGKETWEIVERVRTVSKKVTATREMAEAEVLRVIKEMDSFLIEMKNVIDRGYGEMAESVKNELTLMAELLADKKLEEEGSSLKHWICDAVEIAHDALLIINYASLLTQIGKDPSDFWFMTKEFEPINKALNETTKHILQLGVEGANTSHITCSSPCGDEDVMGFEQDVEFVLRKLIHYGTQTRFYSVCIVGMAGIGKTTLAREVYNHPTTIERYELRVWVSVSSAKSNKEVLMKLMMQLLHNEDQYHVLLEEMENIDNQSLQDMIYQNLKGKRFLIVFDNISKIPYFKSIIKALPNESNAEGTLLLTSRFQSMKHRVLEVFSSKMSTLEMKPLDDDQSWQLFWKLLRFHNQEFPKQLEKKGREMLRNCGGLPLSIKEVAIQFVIKRQGGSEWEELLESPELSGTLAVLESVYHRWPPQVKLHFLCLSFFRKGTPIKIEKLEQIWIIGQVIQQEKEEEDDDYYYIKNDHPYLRLIQGYRATLTKLIEESITEVYIRKKDCIKSIRVNASFHTLSMVKATEEMIFKTLKKGDVNPSSSKEPPHCAIDCSRDEFNHFMNHDERRVSLFFRGGGYFDVSEPYWKRFKQLKTLDFEGFGLKMLPETIGALTELRYLGLRDNYIQELPQSLGHLKNLEVLDIALNFMVEVSDTVWEIGSLRHLYMSDVICRKPLKIEPPKNLETLTYISVDNWTYEVSSWKMMTNLFKLGIEEVDESLGASTLIASLAELKSLQCLTLRGSRFRSLPSLPGLETLRFLREIRLDGLITKLPSAEIFPRMMSHLSLINSCLDEDPMPELGRLFCLKYLKLKNAYTGQQMMITSNGFDSIKVLCVEELWHLRNIEVAICPPELEELEIKSCPFLEDIPVNLISPDLKELKILTTKKLATKFRKWDFISEIDHVDIQP